MSLPAGARIGPYEIVAALGAGGMGQVYRARDTKLGRDVALKVLPPAFVHDPERLARFRREAQVLASLNHPNIAAIYGLEESASETALILELVDGPTLADRIARGPLSLDEALPLAKQIAEALDAAHARGIIHRDLKPANISVREDGTLKVLDFGLAKLADPVGATSTSQNLANSPTVTSPAMTAMGMILGTAAYMSPEQARGRVVDKRADIWAFGCVLYEMLTGRRAFEGDDVSETVAGILRGEPNWSALPADMPAPLRRLLRRSLAKDPARRLPDIGVARLEIDDALSAPPEETPPAAAPIAAVRQPRRWLERAALTLVTLALIGLAVLHFQERPAPRPVFRFQVPPGPGTAFAGGASGAAPSVSPDGRLLVFRAAGPGQPATLWLRNLETMDTRELPGTEGAMAPFWSPDSRFVAFFADRKLKRLELSGGGPQILADLQGGSVGGGAWSPDGTTILFSAGQSPALMRMPAAGGPTSPVTTLAASQEVAHVVPAFLPDGRRFLFRVIPSGIEIGSLDSPERTRLLELDSSALYASPGYLLFTMQDRLVAQRFDAARGVLSGEPMLIGDQVARTGPTYSVSTTGVLVYQSGDTLGGGVPVWVDRTGQEIGPIGAGMNPVQYPRLSPDGQRLAVVSAGDIWVHDVRGRPPIRLTFGGSESPAFSPIWTPDGRRLVYELGGTTTSGLWSLPADGSDRTATPASPAGHYHPHGWSSDGRELLAVELTAGAPPDIVAIGATEPFEKRGVVQTPNVEGASGAALSPDGRWLAYASDPTGSLEIWVRPYPGPGAAVRVSPNGGFEPVWNRSSRELFYREGGKLMSVSIQPGAELQFSPPVMLFDSEYRYTRPATQPPTYDVAPDGRFVFLKPPAPIQSRPLTVVVNWVDDLERRTR